MAEKYLSVFMIPIAAKLGVDPQRLQQFMADSPWEESKLWRAIRREVRIVAIEPEQSNYDLLVRNCSGIANVTLCRAALYCESRRREVDV
jgi:hypothetical protein